VLLAWPGHSTRARDARDPCRELALVASRESDEIGLTRHFDGRRRRRWVRTEEHGGVLVAALERVRAIAFRSAATARTGVGIEGSGATTAATATRGAGCKLHAP
jgi:hypothetical protein